MKEGSIIEYTYTQSSPFLFNLQPWTFQSGYPCLWSEYQVEMPAFFQYATISHGYLPINSAIQDSRHVNFNMIEPNSGGGKDEHFTYDDDVVTRRWVIQNVPALKEAAHDKYAKELDEVKAEYARSKAREAASM